MVIFGKVVVFGKKWLYSGKSCTIRANVVLFGHGGYVRAKVVIFLAMWLNSGKMVVFVQKWLYSGKSGCIRAKVVVFG